MSSSNAESQPSQPHAQTSPTASAQPSMASLYALALQIGGCHNLQALLWTALDAMLRHLDAASGCIYLAEDHAAPPTAPALAVPHELDRNPALQFAQRLLPAPLTPATWQQLLAAPPEPLATPDGAHCYLLPLPDLGFVALERTGEPFAPELLAALKPLLHKLAADCRACIRNDKLQEEHRTTQLERNMLHALIAGTPTVVFALDPAGNFVVSEGGGLQSLARKPGDVVGDSIFDLYRDVPPIVESIRAALRGEQRSVTVALNGRTWDAMYTPVIDPTGAVAGVVGVAHDVTDRTSAVDSLTAVLQTVGEGILSMDATGAILTVNQELERIFGYKQKEMVGRKIDMLIPARHPSAGSADSALIVDLRQALGQRLELEGRTKQGATVPVEICVNPMSGQSAPQFTASLRDISERKEYDRLRDEFVSTVSHELRTPLASIMGWTETLLTEHPGPLNDQQRRFLSIIYASSQRLNRLIEEILTVSRIQRGTLRLGSEPFKPAALLAAIRERTAAPAERQGIQLVLEDHWPADRSVVGDPQLLEQVIAHLVSNAVKFSPSGSSVFVRSTATRDAWRVEVQDSGTGIPADELPKLFQRFVRGSNAKAAHVQGTGLGLYVSKAIVEGHGGEIHLSSHAGNGTTAWFDIPVRSA